MKKTVSIFLAAFLFILSNPFLHAEEKESLSLHSETSTLQSSSSFDIRRLTFGGGLGLQFGDYTLVNISPQVGYNFTNYLNAGVGFNYTYWHEKYHIRGERVKESNSYLGFNVYGRLYPVQNIVVLVQPEISRMWETLKYTRTGDKYTNEKFVPSLLVGAGLRLGPVTAMLQYDVVQDDNSPYGDRIFYSIGYTFTF